MKVWNDINIVYGKRLTFDKVKFDDIIEPELGNIQLSGNYSIDLLNRVITKDNKPILSYTYENEYDFGQQLEIVRYDNVNAAKHISFWSDYQLNEPYVSYASIKACRNRVERRPTDLSQDWQFVRVEIDENCPEAETDSCDCSILSKFFKVEGDYICDGTNKRELLSLERRVDCDSPWELVTPPIFKLGDIIEYDSSECGTIDYEEKWDEDEDGNKKEHCGSEFTGLVPTNKYYVKLPFWKYKDELEWTKVDCDIILEYELIKENSIDCGYRYTKESEDKGLCGNVIKTRYPIAAGSVQDHNKYDIYLKYYSAPYPINTDETPLDQLIYEDEPYEYRVVLIDDNVCECGYVGYDMLPTKIKLCYSALSEQDKQKVASGREHSYLQKYENHNVCDYSDTDGDYEYRALAYESCECGTTARITRYGAKDRRYEYVCGKDIPSEFGITEINYMYYKNYRIEECIGTHIISDYVTRFDVGNGIEFETRRSNAIKGVRIMGNAIGRTTIMYFSSTPTDIIMGGTPTDTYVDMHNGKISYKGVLTYINQSDKLTLRNEDKSTTTVYEFMFDEELYVSAINNLDSDEFNGYESIFEAPLISDNAELISYAKAKHRDDGEGECIYDPTTNANTIYVRYREYYDENDKLWRYLECPERYITQMIKDSSDCGILKKTGDEKLGEACCGEKFNGQDIKGYCEEFGKYEIRESLFSLDNGVTWQQYNPREYFYYQLIDDYSLDCGYVPNLTQWIEMYRGDGSDVEDPTNDPRFACVDIEGKGYALYTLDKQQHSTDKGKSWEDSMMGGQLITRTDRMLEFPCSRCDKK